MVFTDRHLFFRSAAPMSSAAALVTLAIRARDIDLLLACEGRADHQGNFAPRKANLQRRCSTANGESRVYASKTSARE
jgi:hypothetical protein